MMVGTTACSDAIIMKPAKQSSNYEKHANAAGLQRVLIDRFYRVIAGLLRPLDPGTVLDAGCGEGFTIARLKATGIGRSYTGFDISPDAVRIGRTIVPGIPLSVGNVYRMRYAARSFDLVIASEVLEHLTEPVRALAEIRRVAKRHVLLTVPWEPWFWIANFLRGKYPSTWGNHPEHINHWTARSFVRLVSSCGLTVERTVISFPWTIVLARVPDAAKVA